jgi:hypothetical protein
MSYKVSKLAYRILVILIANERVKKKIYLIHPAVQALESTQLLTEMSTRSRKLMFLGSKARPVRRADNLTAICEPIV